MNQEEKKIALLFDKLKTENEFYWFCHGIVAASVMNLSYKDGEEKLREHFDKFRDMKLNIDSLSDGYI